MASKENEVGKKFGLWTVLAIRRKENGVFFECQCNCGTIREVAAITVRNGRSKSCGCTRVSDSVKARLDTQGDPKELTSPEDLKALLLISEGVFPPADQISPKGAPSWTLDSIALMFALSPDKFIAEMKQTGHRFKEAGIQKKEPVQGWAVS